MDPNNHFKSILNNLKRRFAALANGFFDEVFEKEFYLSDDQRALLMEQVDRCRQKQINMIELIFDEVQIDQEVRSTLVLLDKQAFVFWRAIRSAILGASGKRKIGEELLAEKAAASDSLRRLKAALTRLVRAASKIPEASHT